jgi:hypothetical protein
MIDPLAEPLPPWLVVAPEPQRLSCDSPLRVYYVEKVEGRQIRDISDLQSFHDRPIAAVLVSRGRKDFWPQLNVARFLTQEADSGHE